MRKIFKEDMILFEKGINKGRIDWNNNLNRNIRFIYDDITGYITIIDYIHPNVKISYQGKTTIMHMSQFRKCQLGNFLNIYSKDYMYNIGDIINNKIILEQIRMKQGNGTTKGYRYKCLKDNYIGESTEVSFKTLNCPLCSNSIVIKGINDIATTNPELIPYFVNINDAYQNTKGSGNRARFKCLDCGYEKNMEISNFHKNGIQCNKCSDGRSYPSKFVFNLLEQLNIDFCPEKIFKWSNKRYDFYLPIHNIILEIMGNHHFEKSFDFYGGRSTQEEQENDQYKQEMALKNGINRYIVIEARYSDLEYMKDSICNSELSNIFDLNIIDWLQCERFALSNRVKEVCDLWNNGLHDVVKIAKKMKISRSRIWSYLTKGSKLNWCDYNNKWYIQKSIERTRKLRAKKVGIFKDNVLLGTFESMTELVRQSEQLFGVKFSQSKISLVCNGKVKTHKGYTFKFI